MVDRLLPVQDLTEEEINQLIFIREEEKLARDVYLALAEKWNAPIFTNIAQSEQQHMDAVGQLIVKYGLEDPITDDTPGVFTNETLQGLYNGLISRGDVTSRISQPGLVIQGGGTSLMDAYKVGAFIEEYDIIDIEEAIVQTSHSDIENVYENLVRGSRNHLRSFVGQIELLERDYQPVMMIGIDEVTGEDLDALYRRSSRATKRLANGRGSGRQQGQGGSRSFQTASESTIVTLDELYTGLRSAFSVDGDNSVRFRFQCQSKTHKGVSARLGDTPFCSNLITDGLD